jgi:hypothetical protein
MPPLTLLNGPTKQGSYIVLLHPSLSMSHVLDGLELRPAVTHEWDPEFINGFAG